MAYLKVKVTAGAREDAVVGWQHDVLRVKVRAAPARGKANNGLCQFVARRLGLPAARVIVTRGPASRDKLLFIDGLTDEDLRQKLGR